MNTHPYTLQILATDHIREHEAAAQRARLAKLAAPRASRHGRLWAWVLRKPALAVARPGAASTRQLVRPRSAAGAPTPAASTN
jgi:hypothetical protein